MSVVDNFMWFPNCPFQIEGETADEFFRRKKAFEVLSVNFSMEMTDRSAESSGGGDGGSGASGSSRGLETLDLASPARPAQGAGGAGGESKLVATVAFGAFTITKAMDSASPMLYRALCEHAPRTRSEKPKRIPSAMIAMRKPGGRYLLYIQFIFRDLFITDIDWDGGGGEQAPTETVKFVFNALGFQYLSQSVEGAYAGARNQWSWNIPANSSSLAIRDDPSPMPGYVDSQT